MQQEAEQRQKLEGGDGSIEDILMNLLVAKHRTREVRSHRVIKLMCGMIHSIGVLDGSEKSDIEKKVHLLELYKSFLDRLASRLLAFIRNKLTTIVNIERAFEHFTDALDQDQKSAEQQESYFYANGPPPADKGTSVVQHLAHAYAERRKRKGDLVVDRADVDCIVHFIACYERTLKEIHADGGTGAAGVVGFVSLMDLVRVIVEECSVHDSYLDKRDAIENVAIAIERHGRNDD